jgi:hypothetical protein
MKNDDGEKTPATQINMDAPKPKRDHGPGSNVVDEDGRTLRTMGEDESVTAG